MIDVTMVAPYPGQHRRAKLPSGVAAYTERLSTALTNQGVAVKVIAPEVEGEPKRSRVDGVTVERSFRRGARALPTAAGAARRSGAPIVHLQFETFLYGGPSSVPGVAPALANLRTGGKLPVVTLHQVVDPSDVDKEFTQVHRVRVPPTVARLGLSGLQRLVRRLSVSTVVHGQSFEVLVPGSVVVPLGLDVADPVPLETAREIKRSLGLRTDRLTALCFGFLSPYKGIERALEAAAIAGDSVELVIAGGSHPRLASRDPYADDLRRRFGDVARFVGYVPEPEVADWFAAADVLLLPYPRPFASSGPFAQALGFGTPVLCSESLARCVGAPEAMVAPTDPPGLARRLRQLASDPEQLLALTTATQALARGRSWEDAARRHIALYEEVIDAHRPVSRRVRTRESG
ncbi:MAG TPA: glycosyltransferase [Acidimicrobiales bacterium]|jgi:glycosyltransferase involved in cell wall biosynthesis|nr:glycosyltransferase [Acidimicrobiales bacterium]